MEIIKRGVKPDDVDYIVTCSKCSSTLRCTRKDRRSPDYSCNSTWDNSLFTIDCPVCKMGIYVYANDQESVGNG